MYSRNLFKRFREYIKYKRGIVMIKKKLLRRALPVLLSVAMVCQSAPVMSMAAEGDVAYVAEKAVEESKEEESTTAERSKEEESSSAERSREEESATAERSKEEESSSAEKSTEEESSSAEKSGEEESSSADKCSEEETTTDDENGESDTTVTEDSSQEDTGETQEETTTEEEKDDIVIKPSEYDIYTMPNEPVIELAETDFNKGFQTLLENDTQLANNMGELEAQWDNSKYFTEVKNQNPYGTCWAHAAMGLMEYSLKKQNIMENPDLSEHHLAYFAYNTGYDVLGNASNDTITCSNTGADLYNMGGNYWLAANRLLNWQGAAGEAGYPYSTMPDEVASDKAQDTVAILKECYFIPTKDVVTGSDNDKKLQLRNQLKTLIKEYGGVMWTYNHQNEYMHDVVKDGEKESTNYYSGTHLSGTNHAIEVVGWDDNYSRENFPETCRPENDGAWLIRNSWGTSICKDGYMYMSYEERTLGCSNSASVYIAGNKSDYDNNYFYDNVVSNSLPSIGSLNKIAAVYDVKNTVEQLKAVSFISAAADVNYSIQIYKLDTDGTVSNPEKGAALLSEPVTGKVAYSGVYTVELGKSIYLQQNDKFAIVVSFPGKNGRMYTSPSGTSNGVSVHDECAQGQMFINSGSGWSDCGKGSSPYSFNLNALTKDVDISSIDVTLSVDRQKPEGLTGDLVNKLSWNNIDIFDYDVYRKEVSDDGESGEYVKLATVKTGSYDDTIPDTDWGKDFKYKVVVLSTNSNEVNAEGYKLKPVLNTPVCSSAKVSLEWVAISGATSYIIERSIGNADSFEEIKKDCTECKYVDDTKGLVMGDYYYRIKAVGEKNQSLYSDAQSIEAGTVDDRLTVRFFGSDGSLLKIEKVKPGLGVQPPEAPKVTGYEFKSWSEASDNVTKDMDIYAQYTPVKYKITYVLNGGTNNSSNPDTYSIEDSVTLKQPSHSTMYFDGWYDNSSLSGSSVTGISAGSTGDKTFYAKWIEKKEIKIHDIPDRNYTGTQICPSIKVTYGGDVLAEGTDYTVKYSNNVNATQNAQVSISFKGKFNGTYTVTFKILPKNIGDLDISTYCAPAVYNGRPQTPKPVIKWGNTVLKNNTEYTVSSGSYVEAKIYELTVTGKGNFTGSTTVKYEIVDATGKNPMSKVKISKKISDMNYTGLPFSPSASMLTLKFGKEKLTPDIDYIIECSGVCQDAGTYYVDIIGIGDFAGSKQTSFKIKGKAVSSVKTGAVMYTGDSVEPEITDSKGNKLQEGKDYEVTGLSNNIKAGNGRISIKGKGGYMGTATKSFKITPRSITANDVAISFASGSDRQPYNKGGAMPEMKIVYGNTVLEAGTDYTVAYSKNKKMGDRAVARIKGKGNFTGTVEKSFTVASNNMSELSMFCPDKVYSKSAGKCISNPVVTDTNGKKLALNTDYIIKSFVSNGQIVDKKSVLNEGSEVTVTIAGKGMYSGEMSTTYRILTAGYDISKATVKVADCYYDGSAKTITSKDIKEIRIGKNNYLSAGDYEILQDTYVNNKKPGKAKVTIQGVGRYGGRKTISFKIKAQKVN